MAEERIQRYYITRINRETGEIGYIAIERFDELPRARTSIDDVNGYDDATTTSRVVTRLNQISEEIGGKFEYYSTRRDENTFPYLNNLSDEAKKWFEQEEEEGPEEEEEVPEEESTEGE